MEQYKDRATRLDLSFPLTFTTEGEAIAGHCLNLSESGLYANFDQPLEVWTHGDLLLHFGDGTCGLAARVARTNGHEAGLAFAFKSDSERSAIRAMCDFAQRRSFLGDRPPF